LGKQTKKATQLKFYKTMAIPSLLHGSEGWILRRKYESSIQSAEMKILSAVKGCTRLDQLETKNKRRTSSSTNITEIRQYKEKWGGHLQRMETHRLPKIAWEYQPTGKRNPGRPRMRWTVEPEQTMEPRP
jgi:hypothetical protein